MKHFTLAAILTLFLGAQSFAQDAGTSRAALERELTEKINSLGAGFPSNKKSAAPLSIATIPPRPVARHAGPGRASLDPRVATRLQRIMASN